MLPSEHKLTRKTNGMAGLIVLAFSLINRQYIVCYASPLLQGLRSCGLPNATLSFGGSEAGELLIMFKSSFGLYLYGIVSLVMLSAHLLSLREEPIRLFTP